MWNTLLLEIFSVFPSAGIVGCFVFAFLHWLFLLVGFGPSLYTPCIPLGVLVPFLVLIYLFINQKQKKKNLLPNSITAFLGLQQECLFDFKKCYNKINCIDGLNLLTCYKMLKRLPNSS